MTGDPVIRPEPWLRAGQAAEHLGLGIGRDALLRLKRVGLPYHKMGEAQNEVSLYLASELDQWQANHSQLPQTPPVYVRRPRYRPRRPLGE